MSGLTKKIVFADRLLSALLGVKEGELVSYSQLSKGLHKYIKDNDLKNPNRTAPSAITSPPSLPGETINTPVAQLAGMHTAEVRPNIPAMKKCKDCAADIPAEATFCDLCGVQQ
jgi:hypothetical protein